MNKKNNIDQSPKSREGIRNIEFNFEEKSELFFKLSRILNKENRITIGLSGGSDSMFTAILIYKYFLENAFDTRNISIAHCNHKIRKESEKEQKFVEEFFGGCNLTVFERDSSLPKNENSLRKWRYECFEEIIKKFNSDLLVLGHNLTDRIETTFLNLLRGASLNGFVGMNYIEDKNIKDNYTIIRPVLDLTKQYIMGLCDRFGIPYFQDKTNLDPKTSKRNYLRLKVLPLIYELSNKCETGSNTFVESFAKIYGEIGIQPPSSADADIPPLTGGAKAGRLKVIKLSRYWGAKWGYVWEVKRKEIQIQDLVGVLKELKIYGDVNSKFLGELVGFLQVNDDGYKYFNGTYIFVAHDKIYFINGPKLFWKKTVDEHVEIKKLGKIAFGDFEIEVKDENLIGSVLRFPEPKDVYKGKNLNKYLLNKKVPLFWRRFRLVCVKEGEEVVKVF